MRPATARPASPAAAAAEGRTAAEGRPAAAAGRTAAAPAKCAGCDAPLDVAVICERCHTLVSSDNLGYFELLGLAPAFDVDVDDLRTRYLRTARLVHPDRLSGDDDGSAALRLSARVNRAYEVLADPALRAEYLLELAGGPSAAQDKGVAQDVLLETLDIREQIADALAAGDVAALRRWRDELAARHAAGLDRAAGLARRLPGDEPLRVELRMTLNGLKYITKMLQELSESPASATGGA